MTDYHMRMLPSLSTAPRRSAPPRSARRSGIGSAVEKHNGRANPPTITLVFVSGLAHPDVLLEIDAVAVVPQ